MGTDSSCQPCCGGMGKLCRIVFKLIIAGLLTCIASSLWEIEKSVAKMSATAKP